MNIEVTKGELAPTMYSERCPRCNGTGRYQGLSSLGRGCFKCGGSGRLIFKNSPEQRAANREKAADRKMQEQTAQAVEWRIANPAAAKWIDDNKAANPFADAMAMNLLRFGSLTPAMLGAIMRKLEHAAAPVVERPQVSMPTIEAAFERAKAAGIKYPKVNMGEFKMSPAGAASTNAGAIYVKSRDGTYLGKVLGGTFSRSRDCTAELEASIVDFARDPKAAAEAYGKKYGVCCICSRELSDPVSVERGIGPICADRMGW